MKKIMMTIAAVICCAMTTTVFTSCGDDDETTTSTDRTPVAAHMEYKLEVGDQMLTYFDMTVEYYDSDGTLKTEQMTQKTWSKTVRAKLPVTLGARLKGTPKANVDLNPQEKVTYAYGYYYTGYAVSSTDLVVGNIASNGVNSSYDVPSDKVAEWIQRVAGGITGFQVAFDANGKATGSTWK